MFQLSVTPNEKDGPNFDKDFGGSNDGGNNQVSILRVVYTGKVFCRNGRYCHGGFTCLGYFCVAQNKYIGSWIMILSGS
jgi:hypothetical protein